MRDVFMKALSVSILLSLFLTTAEGNSHHLVKCSQNIALRYFTARTVVISNSNFITSNKSHYDHCHVRYLKLAAVKDANPSCLQQDTRKLLMTAIHQNKKWSILVLEAQTENPKLQNTTIEHGNYILLVQEVESAVEDIRLQIKQLKTNIGWNPRAKHIVMILQTGISPNNTLTQDILSELWHSKVVNAVVLKQLSASKLNIYTSFPYHPRGRCGDIRDVVLLDICVTNKEGNSRFLHNTSLFPAKIPRDLYGCPFTVSTFEYEPFMMKRKATSTVEYEDGLDLRLIRVIGQAMNMTMVLQPPPPDGSRWGFLLENGTWVGVTAEILQGYSDLALVGWFYRCHIINEIECSFPYLIDEARWYVPCAQPYPRWTSLTRVFKYSLWLGFLTAYVIVALVMWQVVKISNSICTVPIENQAYTSLVKCLLNFWAIILEESASNNPPHVAVIRGIFLVWVLYCWAVNTVYQTYLTSFLINPGLQHQLSSEEEILQSGIAYGIPTTMVSILPGLSDNRYRRKQPCDNVEACQQRLATKGDLALFFTKYNNEYMAALKYMDGDGKPLVCQFDGSYYRQYVVIPVPKGNPMLDAYNKVIRLVHQAGLIEKWWKDLKYTATLSSAKDFNLPVGEYIKLTLAHLQSAFYFLFLGYGMSVISFLSEKLCCHKLTVTK